MSNLEANLLFKLFVVARLVSQEHLFLPIFSARICNFSAFAKQNLKHNLTNCLLRWIFAEVISEHYYNNNINVLDSSVESC